MKVTTKVIGIAAIVATAGGLIFAGSVRLLGAPQQAKPTPALSYNWRNVAVVGGGFVSGIITHPTEKGLMYARTDVGGAYRWDDRSKRWIPLTDEFGLSKWNWTGIESIAVDPTDPNKVYAAVGTYTNNWAGNGAMLRSIDRGNTWKRTDLPFKNGGNMEGRFAGERLVVDPSKPSHLLFGSRDNGLWESNDNGATWNQVAGFPVQGKTNVVGIAFVVFDKAAKAVYAGVSDKSTWLYRSTDSGKTWAAVPGQPTGLLVNHGVLDGQGNVYFTNGDAVGPNDIHTGTVQKWNTKTGTWTNITPEVPGEGNTFGYGGVTVDAQKPNTVMVSTIDRWARHDTLFRSTNGGQTWQDIGPASVRDSSLAPFLKWGRPEADLGHWIGDIEIDPHDSNHVLYVTGMTIWASTDATIADQKKPTHWVVGANGIEETVVNALVSPSEGAPLLSAVSDIDGFRHTDLNVSPRTGFFQPAHGNSPDLDIAEKNPNILARVNGIGAYSEDNGVTWKEFAGKPAGRGFGHIAVSADGATFVWTPDRASNPFYSTDKGATWTATTGLPKPARVVSDRENPNVFYATDNGTFYVSTDKGATFAAKASDLPAGDSYVHAVPGRSGDVWVCAEGAGLRHSIDNGTTFAAVDGITEAHRIGFGKAAPGRDYPAVFVVGKIGDTEGFFRSDDGGHTWVRINDNRHSYHYINAITGDPRVYGRVYLATGGRGIVVGEAQGN